MAQTIKDALNHASIEEVKQLLSEYKFRLSRIPVEITIRLYKGVTRGGVWFEQSHYMSSPTQGSPYVTSRPHNSDEADALHQAVRGFTTYYDEAIAEGHSPNENWLVRNDRF